MAGILSALIDALSYLLQIATTLYVTIIMLRFFMQYFRTDFYNPVAQFVVKATTPVLKPVRKVVPGWRGMDIASILVAYLIMLAFLALDYYLNNIFTVYKLPFAGLLLSTLLHLIKTVLNLFFFATLLQAILSWVQTAAYSPVTPILRSITEPFLRPIRKRLPATGGIDFSSMIAMVLLMACSIFIERIHLYTFGFWK